MGNANQPNPLLIIGAGISGLILAQACRKQGIPYRLFERDASATHRSAGWGLTIHWALPALKSLLPEDILERLPETYVNREGVERGEKGSFTFFDLSTGEAKWKVPASERIRVSRERLRKLLLTDVEVEWNRGLVDLKAAATDDDGVVAVFTDSTEAKGVAVVGCDGANSQVRKLCHPKDFESNQLPIRFIGAGVHYSKDQIAGMKELDPFFLQGSDPRTDVFLWFSFLNTPEDPDSDEGREDKYYCQIMTSWPFRPGFWNRKDPTEMPATREEQLAWMKTLASKWTEPFCSVVSSIPEDCEIMAIHLADWLPRLTKPSADLDGTVVLVGDAAHNMVMYRGEGANHAVVDVSRLLEQIQPLLLQAEYSGGAAWREAIGRYEGEMIERSELGVLASRQACLDAHDYTRLNDRSPLVNKRVMKADLEKTT